MSASDPGNRDDDTSEPARIERQIEEARGHLTDTLTALEHKLSTRQITNDVIDAVRDTVLGTGTGQKTMLDLVRRNPLPAVLIGIGVGWMVFGTTSRRSRRRAAAAPAMAPVESEPARGDGDAGSRIDRLQDRAGTMMQDNPLAVGALGAVIGALIGAILPMTRRENDFLTETQQQVVDQATEIGRDAVARAREVAKHAGQAAVQVVEQELGLASKRGANGTRKDESIH